MKRIRIRMLETSNLIITWLLTLTGFAVSCEINDPKVEYGTPSAEFKVIGTVKSVKTDQPVQNITIIMQGKDTVTSNEQGEYVVSDKWGFPEDQTYNIQFKDMDGSLNGEYENLDTIAEFNDPEFINGDGKWFQGETSKELNVKLKDKE